MKSTHKYLKSYALGLKRKLEYRFDFFTSIFSSIFTLLVLITLWRAIYSTSNAELLYGYTFQQMLFYVVSSTLLSKMITTDIMNDVSIDIKDGGLNKFLIQPFNYIRYRFSVLLGEKTCESVVVLGLIIILTLLMSIFSKTTSSFSCFAVALGSIVLSIILNFYLSFIIATFAFWITDTFYLNFGLNVVLLVLSGAIFPIDILPPAFVVISRYLPFQYISFFPVKILTGSIDHLDLLFGLFMQVCYIVALRVISKLFWDYGVKKHIAVGG